MDRHRARHDARLKNIVVQAGLDEMARLVERTDPLGSASATAWHLRLGSAWRTLPAGFSTQAHGLRLVPALDREGLCSNS